jgi:tRNA(adenine34) deaminase
MLVLTQLARCALAKKELPIAAVLGKDDEIICEAPNLVVGNKELGDHAEWKLFLAAREHLKRMKRAERNSLVLYITIEPCLLCSGWR